VGGRKSLKGVKGGYLSPSLKKEERRMLNFDQISILKEEGGRENVKSKGGEAQR